MALNALDLIVEDVPGAAAFFRDALGLSVAQHDERFAEVDAGAVRIMLSPDAMVPIAPAVGVILHFEVEDVGQALERARAAGARVLLGPVRTDWGWESALVAGPGETVVDLYRPVAPEQA
jgi:predicted enzyme related to lactoylglutathione lyase